jgi:hypothetical protein
MTHLARGRVVVVSPEPATDDDVLAAAQEVDHPEETRSNPSAIAPKSHDEAAWRRVVSGYLLEKLRQTFARLGMKSPPIGSLI